MTSSPPSPPQPQLSVTDQQARVAAAVAFAAQGLMFTVLLTHLPQFTDKYEVSDATVTVIVFTVTVLAGLGSLGSELLAAAISSRRTLRYALLLVACAGTVIGLAPGLPLFIAGFAVYGIGVGAVDATANMQAVAVQHRYGRSILTSFHAAWSAGAIAGALYVSGGERLSISLPVSISPVAVVVLIATALAGPYLLRSESRSNADPDPRDPDRLHPDHPDHPEVKNLSLTKGPLLMLGLAMTCYWAVDSGASNWSALYLHDVLLASGSTAALAYAVYQALALFSRLSGDHIVRRLGAVRTVRAGAVIGTAGTVLVVAAPGPVVAILGFGLAGLGLPVIAPLCFSAAGATVLGSGSGLDAVTGFDESAAVERVVARLNVFNYFGSLVGAGLIGAVATPADLRAGFVVPVVLAAAVFFLAKAFGRPGLPG
jgi:fucose permease